MPTTRIKFTIGLCSKKKIENEKFALAPPKYTCWVRNLPEWRMFTALCEAVNNIICFISCQRIKMLKYCVKRKNSRLALFYIYRIHYQWWFKFINTRATCAHKVFNWTSTIQYNNVGNRFMYDMVYSYVLNFFPTSAIVMHVFVWFIVRTINDALIWLNCGHSYHATFEHSIRS